MSQLLCMWIVGVGKRSEIVEPRESFNGSTTLVSFLSPEAKIEVDQISSANGIRRVFGGANEVQQAKEATIC